MYDLPVKTKEEQKNYSDFRNSLIKLGYIMVQYSIYTKFCKNKVEMHKQLNRLLKMNPKFGDIRVLTLTEHQYTNMIFIKGKMRENEKLISDNPMIIID